MPLAAASLHRATPSWVRTPIDTALPCVSCCYRHSRWASCQEESLFFTVMICHAGLQRFTSRRGVGPVTRDSAPADLTMQGGRPVTIVDTPGQHHLPCPLRHPCSLMLSCGATAHRCCFAMATAARLVICRFLDSAQHPLTTSCSLMQRMRGSHVLRAALLKRTSRLAIC